MNIRSASQANFNPQSGNVFFIILVAVVLFAALAFTVARGFRSDTTSSISERTAELEASNLLDFAQKIERAVNRVRSKDVSENDISFEYNGAFVNASCDAVADPAYPGCQIFNPDGGSVSYTAPETNVTADAWHFTGSTCIADIGLGATGCDSDGLGNEELLIALTNVDQRVCERINARLNISGVPTDTGGGVSTTAFDGSFNDDTEIILAGGPFNAACFTDGSSNTFYYVLLAR